VLADGGKHFFGCVEGYASHEMHVRHAASSVGSILRSAIRSSGIDLHEQFSASLSPFSVPVSPIEPSFSNNLTRLRIRENG
jgi:hypothetical protein